MPLRFLLHHFNIDPHSHWRRYVFRIGGRRNEAWKAEARLGFWAVLQVHGIRAPKSTAPILVPFELRRTHLKWQLLSLKTSKLGASLLPLSRSGSNVNVSTLHVYWMFFRKSEPNCRSNVWNSGKSHVAGIVTHIWGRGNAIRVPQLKLWEDTSPGTPHVPSALAPLHIPVDHPDYAHHQPPGTSVSSILIGSTASC